MNRRQSRAYRSFALGLAGLAITSAAAAGEPAPYADPQQLTQRIETLERQVRSALNSDSTMHLAGYADASYVDSTGSPGGFNRASFNPIVHYLYRDRVLLEAELEILVNEQGGTDVALEYGSIDLFLPGNAMLIAGRFLSPLGNFRQNLHPSWINKLPSEPAGYGHEGAAPSGELGAQLRGGFDPGGPVRVNYAVYVGNGPNLMANGGELEAVETEGVTSAGDDSKVWGGRIGVLPIAGLELGVSAADGKASVTKSGGAPLQGDPARRYAVLGFDAAWRPDKAVDLRAEWIRQRAGEAAASIAPMAATWEAWYAQSAYRIGDTPWEGVVRYGKFDSPNIAMNQKQVAVGVDYWIGPGTVLKLGYELNDGEAGSAAAADRLLLQAAYGF